MSTGFRASPEALISPRAARLYRLASTLELLASRLRAEPEACARLGDVAGDIRLTRKAVDARFEDTGGEGLSELSFALWRLETVVVAWAGEQALDLSRPGERRRTMRAERLRGSTRRLLRRVATAVAVGSTVAASAMPVAAQTVIDRSGALGAVNEVSNVDTILNVGGLTQNIAPVGGAISLTGGGAAPSSAVDQSYSCNDPALGACTITPAAPPTSSTVGGVTTITYHPSTCAPVAKCVLTPLAVGPSGVSGASLTVNVDSGAYIVAGGANAGAFGVVSRSTGDSGGNGGNAYVAGNAGDGGDGADGGLVHVNVSGHVTTTAAGGPGVAAFSTGGNGGNGGSAYVIGGSAGSGGKAGFGGSAYANFNSGTVTTQGADAFGVGAVSQGGNGGRGGGGGGLVFSPGGGDAAGAGGRASVTTGADTTIETFGANAHGIVGQSMGGGGGGGSGGFGLFYSGGGSGSTGGDGGLVEIDARGVVRTHGANAYGILAQSIGGGGGNGGTSAGAVSLGGSGGVGGYGGRVDVKNSGAVSTTGLGSSAIHAQSIGGGGGNGGSSGGLVSLGGSGSNTTKGGVVTVTNSGLLTTASANAVGIFAQSVGGGGGNGGHAGGLFSAGGGGGAGADGRAVTILNTGDIETGTAGAASINSHGIFAQSVGGGGGNGGGAVAVGAGFAASFGGTGGSGGMGGSVDILRDNVDPALAQDVSIITHGDQSSAIVAQSVGGGGGNGGFSVSAATGNIGVALGVGGGGGAGGDAGEVLVETKGALRTSGAGSHGLFAQSVGGGGGNGGFAIAVANGDTASAAVAIGGTGGAGGVGGNVTVDNLATIDTSGDLARGIYAQSVGGGGGNGGFTVGVGNGGAFSAAVTLGGSGGTGQIGGVVDVTSAGNVTTGGIEAHGLFAQSVGGGGGNGGFAVSGAMAGGAAVTIGLGGDAGTGAAGGLTVASSTGDFTTSGTGAYGFLVQSVGGGGGAGGFSGALSGAGAGAIGFSMGGSGGSGGTGGDAFLYQTGRTRTLGDNAIGLMAQSVGGGGGTGGFSFSAAGAQRGAVSVALGGAGGIGGAAGLVELHNTGQVSTAGALAHGVVAQSVGGGGGTGGMAISGALASGLGGVSVGLGGNGGTGGVGQTVLLDQKGSVATEGAGSIGVFAQSVGGGGGNGGMAGSMALNGGGAAAAVALGGTGVSGGTGGKSELKFANGTVTTKGDNAVGILSQSVGGGGGVGGIAVAAGASTGMNVTLGLGGKSGSGSTGGEAILDAKGDVYTEGSFAHGIVAQSVGGGGGQGAVAISGSFSANARAFGLGFGSDGGSGGSSGYVKLDHTGYVETLGDGAKGVLAQSIGGGGGNGGYAVSFSIAAERGSFAGAIGGKGGGSGGFSGKVDLTNIGDVRTHGAGATGVMAQSVGGGGGDGHFGVSLKVGQGFGYGLGMGGSGGSGATAEQVKLIQTGNVVTGGDFAHGVLAQSVGGGGGTGGFAVSAVGSAGGSAVNLSMGGDGGSGGSSAGADLKLRGDIETTGVGANAVVAQSVGGGGGSGGFSGALTAAAGSAVSFSMGGDGGTGGSAGVVKVDSQGLAITHGDQAVGILAQSVGGGGGKGGMSISAQGAGQTSVTASVGGSGGTGGTGGLVDLDHVGDVLTEGDLSYGVLAQSIGGGGGAGGFSITGSLSTGGSGLTGSLGGTGGSGNTAGKVEVDYTGGITTRGDGAHALFAQSVGGGGGSGGFSGALSLGLASGASVGVSLGGHGGSGGWAGDLDIAGGSGVIRTEGLGASGIKAQSVGGGGGDGGFSFAATLTAGNGATGLAAAIGGDGGTGGKAGKVEVRSGFSIFTLAKRAVGIFAQSIGGGGGSGGVAASGSVTVNPGSKQASISVGGDGGTGNHGGEVIVASTGQVVTKGEEADGVFAQSVGGGGGDGGLTFSGAFAGPQATQASVSVGGAGGAGGVGGRVEVGNMGLIDTTGKQSNGIYAQSIGGGGGRGGFAIGAALSMAGEGTNLNVGVTVGGKGGVAGTGGVLDIDNSGQITTRGYSSSGIYAQSVGGGGGQGGGAFTGVAGLGSSNPDSRTVNVSVAVGGGGGNGNNGGLVDVANSGRIETFGGDSFGVFAQSVGGGGGSGGQANAISMILFGSNPDNLNTSFAVSVGGDGGGASNGGVVKLLNSGQVLTHGDVSDGLFAQSIGGGGGNGGNGVLGIEQVPLSLLLIPVSGLSFTKTLTIAVGGDQGSSGQGGDLDVDNTGLVITRGGDSNGIFAQSVGGGGGRGGVANIGLAGLIGIGGKGGASGGGGIVDVNNAGNIETFGPASNGIFAQSVGGGGGIAGNVDRGFPGGLPLVGNSVPHNLGIGLAFGANGGGGGDGGLVKIANTGNIYTHGAGSSGLFAQSVGGGGGLVGSLGNDVPLLSLMNFAGSVGDAGSAGRVEVTHTGTIQTDGAASYGIFAQSAGGQGTGGVVDIKAGGAITASAANTDAILAQSTGLGGAGNILVTVTGGTVTGGSGTGAGLRLYNGADNLITNSGVIRSAGGLAIAATDGRERVENHGVLIGDVTLGAGTDVLTNHVDGELRSGGVIALGAGEAVTNHGLISPGGDGVKQTTALSGNLTQSATGNLRFDLDFARPAMTGEADRIDVAGTVALAGKVTAHVLNVADIKPGDHAVTILTGTGGVTSTTLALDAPTSAIAKFELRRPDANSLTYGYTVDFSPADGLTGNQTAVGDYINAVQTAGGSAAFGPVIESLFAVPTTQELAAVYDRLTPDVHLDQVTTSGRASLGFTEQMFSCGGAGGRLQAGDDESCGWSRINFRAAKSDATPTGLAYDEDATSVTFGGEKALEGGWRLGGSLGIENADLVTTGHSTTSSDRVYAGAVIKKMSPIADFAFAVSGGTGSSDSYRLINVAGNVGAMAEQDLSFLAAAFKVSRLYEHGMGWVRPSLEIGGSKVRLDAFNETGAGPLNLRIAARSETTVRVKPSVEAGLNIPLEGDAWLRPSLRVGTSRLVDGDLSSLTASFEGAPTGVGPYTVQSKADKRYTDLQVGLEWANARGASFRVGYNAQIGDTVRQSGGHIKLTVPF
jgi:hypothetical protein